MIPDRTEPFIRVLDAATRQAVIDDMLKRLEAHYLVPDLAVAVVAAIRARLLAGAYDGLTDPTGFARTLTVDLQAASHDRHLVLLYPAPPAYPGGAAEREARQREAILHQFGVRRLERLAGNVGYLDVRRFDEGDEAGAVYRAAMQVLVSSFALIIDLRHHHGGHPSVLALLCGYFLGPEPVHLCDFHWREPAGERIEPWWTTSAISGPRYLDRPLWLLTGAATFSGAEAFAYFLRNRRRAVVVGERTGGGAHYSTGITIAGGFGLGLPAARVIDPLTGTDWEGTGVEPDLPVPAERALDVAHAAALRYVLATFPDPATEQVGRLRREAEARLRELEAPT